MYKIFSRSVRGFTLIELLVVIAIIGILASVVLVSLNSARNKGNDAAVKANLGGVRTQAELVYDSSGNSYATVCTSNPIADALTAADNAGPAGDGVECFDTVAGWVATAQLHDTTQGYWCVDNTGKAGTTTNPASADGQTCTGL